MNAPTKDDVYDTLRQRGIRAIKVTERITPVVKKGFHGLTHRDWLLLLLAVALAGAALAGVALAVRDTGPLVAPTPGIEVVEKVAPDPAAKAELEKYIEARKAKEAECREQFIRRVKEGTLSKERANSIFRAMGMQEIP